MTAKVSPDRADPFASLDDLGDFAPITTPKPKTAPELVRQISEASNFPSRSPVSDSKEKPAAKPQRRHRTGRNVQFNIKATQETIERFTRLADANGWVFGEALDRACDAIEAKLKTKV